MPALPNYPSWRIPLATARLLCLYVAFCYILLEIGFTSQSLIEAAPFWPNALTPTSNAAYPTSLAGINVSLQQYTDASQRQAALENLRAAGFGWVRQRVDWSLLEPVPGGYEWAQMDDILADVSAVGLEVVVVLDGSPVWARAYQDRPPTDNPFAPPADNADLARFVAAFATRYGEQVRFYQIWDEPNIAPHWGNRLIEPTAYGRMLADVVPSIRAVDADAVILLAALAPTGDRGHTAIDEAYYLQRVYAAGAAPHFDAVAAQPFGFGLSSSDTRSRASLLNFQRIGLLRRVMVAAGDGAKPLWAVRYGWNRSTNRTWQTVTAQTQARYVAQANELARGWPWLAGMGWAIDRPAAPADDPLWGFSLYTPVGEPTLLLETFLRVNYISTPFLDNCTWIRSAPDSCAERDNADPAYLSGVEPSPTRDLVPLLGTLLSWALALLWVVWRAWRAGQGVGVDRWVARFAAQPLLVKTAAWLLLALVYYFATWPPLIGLCWLLAALFLAAEPLVALVLVGALLPFHFQHKELHLVGTVLTVSPAYAVLLWSLPGLVRSWLARLPIRQSALHLTDWLALGWLGISLLSAGAAWRGTGTPGGFWWLVAGPLLIYLLGCTLATTSVWRRWAVVGLAGGGVLAALFGLILWLDGAGTVADGVRRLVGLTFSPNQTALMLVRALFLCMGLALANRRFGRWLWHAGAGVITVVLLLTGSRGALLLGIPAGVVPVVILQPVVQRRLSRRPWLMIAVGGGVLAVLALGLGERLLNSGTVVQRLYIWQGALDLWRAYPWLGVGPGGFFWHYPAFMIAAAASEPNLFHPHSLWLELATGWGLPGLAWAICFGYWLVRRVAGQIQSVNYIEMGLLAALVAGIAHGQVDAFGALPELAAWNWLVLGLLRNEDHTGN